MNALVTGGAGFIGSHIANELVCRGENVTALDNLSSGTKRNLHPDVSLIVGDIRDGTTVARALEGIDTLYHLAAFTSVPLSFKEEALCREMNVEAFENCLRLASTEGVEKIVLSSSSAVYPDAAVCAQSETSEISPGSPYGETKAIGEKLLEEWSTQNTGRCAVSLRYFNVYGPNQDGNSPYASVIPRFIMQILRKEAVTVYGTGDQTRDYVFVRDVVRANIDLATQPGYNCYAVGTGQATTINQLVSSLREICDCDIERIYLALPKGDAIASMADNRKLLATGWVPETSIEEGLRKTWQWYADSAATL
jgi:nucleoside-diphosphate-sugar epimerase